MSHLFSPFFKKFKKQNLNKGFTLLELLIVVGIIAITSVAIVLILNPAEALKKSRDTQRISDLNALKKVLGIYQVSTSYPKMAGIDNSGCKGTVFGSTWQLDTDHIYYSLPTESGIITGKVLDGVTFTTGGASQVTKANLGKVDGTGWLPIDFTVLSGGSPISNLPVDPVNKIADPANPKSTDLVYRYVCSEQNLTFEIDATLESNEYTVVDNKMAKDGGDNDNYYETGTELDLIKEESLAVIPPTFACGQNFLDTRDSFSYSTIDINGQCWFSQNLSYLPDVAPSATGSTSTPYYYVFGYQGLDINAAKLNSNYNIYGVLYNYLASTTSCPASWHLPSDLEWTSLTNYAGGSLIAGDNLKASTLSVPPWDGLDTYNFKILPAGRRHVTGSFFGQGTNAYYWTSTPYVAGVWVRGFNSGSLSFSRSVTPMDYGYSVRCIKD
jgi:uncharacterized protein (TIGR02145 family)/prepilin-type N-terminal cleavage/methylation domain-containing protein